MRSDGHQPGGTHQATETILDEAKRIINGQRRKDYGDVTESFERIAAGWSAILGAKVTATEVALMMSWLKIARFVNAKDRDSLVDLSGYAALAAQLEGIDE